MRPVGATPVIADLAAILLGAAFIAAGILKLLDPGWPEAATALGTPAFAVRLIGPLEIALGALVASGLGAPWPAVAAVGLLVAFTFTLVRALRTDDPPVCACFGGLSRRPVGRASVVRNLVLIALGFLALGA
jgi:uncharacterized membrane protein YphA (DoxX/SURF4 family)